MGCSSEKWERTLPSLSALADPPLKALCVLGWCLLRAWLCLLQPGSVAYPGLFGRWASSSWEWGHAPLKASLQAEEAEREERKRLESQREAEWKKEEERLRLEEEQKVRRTPILMMTPDQTALLPWSSPTPPPQTTGSGPGAEAVPGLLGPWCL